MKKEQIVTTTQPRGGVMNSLEGKVALITGGGQGLGEAIGRVLSSHGASVVLGDIKVAEAELVASSIVASGGTAEAIPLDVQDETGAKKTINKIVEKYGKLDFLVNNAGIDVTKSVDEMSTDEFKRIISVNLIGPFLMSKIAISHMEALGHGHIVNITSTAAKRAWANASAYHASKWGLLGLSYSLYVEARTKKIKVTAVVAGGMRTPFILERFPETDITKLQDPNNVAETIAYVLSQPEDTIIPEVMVLPLMETSWP